MPANDNGMFGTQRLQISNPVVSTLGRGAGNLDLKGFLVLFIFGRRRKSGKTYRNCFQVLWGDIWKTFVVYVCVLSGDVSVKAGFCQEAGKMGAYTNSEQVLRSQQTCSEFFNG